MKKLTTIIFILIGILFICSGISRAQGVNLLGVLFKLQGMRDEAVADIHRYEGEIHKCSATIGKCENIIGLARQKGNAEAERIAGDALAKARQAKLKNEELRNSAAFRKKRAEIALASIKKGDRDLEVKLEQVWFENNKADWTEKQKQLIAQRLREPNKWCSGIHASLTGEVPPLPYKKFNELQSGDVLLIGGGGLIAAGDNLLSGDKVSDSSHTVSYLKEVNGKKLFLDNQPDEGPRIISEDGFLEKYGSRGAEVARLVGQPLNEKQAKQLFTAAVKMAQKNRNKIANNWFGSTYFGTNYGVWGKDNVVCSEADWALLNAADQKIPKSGDQIKVDLGIDFSPADYRNQQYFLVTPLAMPK